jgi:hypothetical protein
MKYLAFLFLIGLSAFGQTTIMDTLYSPVDGALYTGSIAITAPSMTCSGVTYYRSTQTYAISNGAVTVTLRGNDACSVPQGESNGYKVVYSPRRGSGWVEWWVVPTSATNLRVNAVRAGGQPPVSPISILPQNIGLGGATPGQALVAGPTGWVPGTVAGGGSGSSTWGGILGTLSDQTDLWAELSTKITQAQARTSITGTAPIVVNQSTGAISCPTCGQGGGGAVSSVFTRTGDVVATAADYQAYYPLLSGSYSNPSWINSLPYTKISGTPSIPTTTSQLTNDSGFLLDSGSYANPNWLASVSVAKLTGIAGTPDNTKFLRDDFQWAPVSSGAANWGQINGSLASQLDLTAALAGKQSTITTGTSSQYIAGDLSLKLFPTIPTTTSQLTNDSGYLQSSGSYANPAWITSLAFSKITGHPVIPSATSQLTNDSGFLLSSGSYANPTWLTSLAYSKLTGTPTIPTLTSQISESVNLYYTDVRARAAITGSAPITVTSGVVACPTCITSQYSLPVATASTLGGVKQGSGVSIAGDGVISVTAGGGNMSVNSGTVDPSGACTPGQAWYLRTDVTPQTLWFCSASGTWLKVLATTNVGQWQTTGSTGAALSAPAAGSMSAWFDSTTRTLYTIDEAGTKSTTVIPDSARTANAFVDYIGANGVAHKVPIVAADVPDISGTYSTKSASGDLAGVLPAPTVRGINGTLLSGLTTGLLKVTNGTGAVTTATAADISAHATNHKNGGSDEVATATAAANAIPKAGAGGTLAAGWIPDLSATYQIVSAALVKTSQANTYTAGMKQTVSQSATTAGLNLGALSTTPSGPVDGDVWKASGNLFVQQSGGTKQVAFTDSTVNASQLASGDKAGSGAKVPMTSALGTAGNCVAWGATGLTDAGQACGTGGGASVTGLYSAAIDFPSIADGSCNQQTFAATGATTGSAYALSLPSSLDTGLVGTAFASAVDTIAVRVCNFSGAAVDPASLTYKVRSLDALGYLTASATIDFASLSDGVCGSNTLTVTGAATGDNVAPGWPSGLESGLVGAMYVSSANTVTVRLCNWSGASLDPASATFKAGITR